MTATNQSFDFLKKQFVKRKQKALSGGITTLYRQWENTGGRLYACYPPNLEMIGRYSRIETAKSLAGLFNRLINEQPSAPSADKTLAVGSCHDADSP